MKNKYRKESKVIGILYFSLIPLFSLIYLLLASIGSFTFTSNNAWIDSTYLSVVTLTTLGYGDILPLNEYGKIAVSLQSILGVLLIGLFLNAISSKRSRDLEIEEEKKKFPARKAAYLDVSLFINRFISFWSTAYNESVPGKELKSLENLFKKESFDQIGYYLDIRLDAPILPSMKWKDYLLMDSKELKELGARILQRYSSNLNSEALGFLHKICEDSLFFVGLEQINTILSFDKINGFNRLPILGSFSPTPSEDDFNAILTLKKWCEEEYVILSKEYKEIRKVTTEVTNINPKLENPKAMYNHK